MRSVWISRQGGPEVLQVRESPDPEPGPGQVRIRVKAAGINFADLLMRQGLYPGAPKVPFVPGYEAAGVIDRLGSPADGRREGERVVVPSNFGGYSDTLVARADEVLPIPEGKSFESAAALTVNYLTAYEAMVNLGHIKKGQSMLVHGAAGGVGTAAAQIARIFDVEVFGTASPSKHGYLKRLGVAHCIDYNTEDFEAVVRKQTRRRGVDLVLDPIGGYSFRKSYRSLAPGGKLILYGFSAAEAGGRRSLLKVAWQAFRTPRFSSFDLMMENRGVIGLHLGRMTGEKARLLAGMTQLVAWWREGRIEPQVGKAFPFTEAAEAHRYIHDRKSTGKVVLTMP